MPTPHQIHSAITRAGRLADRWLPFKIQAAHIPGLSIAIAHRGRVLYTRGFGWAVDHQKQATAHTQYRIASVSKVFTAIAILQLAEKKSLLTNDRVIKHLPELGALLGKRRSITIANLLNHTASIWRDGDTAHWSNDRFPNVQRLLHPSQSSIILARETPTFKYSNYGYALLGEIVARVSGQSYESYVRQHILRPLDLRHTRVDYSRPLSSLAIGYSRITPSRKQYTFRHVATRAYAPATGFLACATDLAKLTGAWSTRTHQLLAPSAKKRMGTHGTRTGFPHEQYGFGLGQWKINGRRVVGHGGGFAGFTTNVIFDPQTDIGIVALSNSLGSVAPGISEGILTAIWGFLHRSPTGQTLLTRRLVAFEGIYRDRWGDKLLVADGPELLVLNPHLSSPLSDPARLVPTRDEFRIKMKNHYDLAGEPAHFTGPASRRILWWGPTPMKRISKPV